MEREIKFRAWDKSCNKMRGISGLQDCFSLRSDGVCNEDYILLQYTGLKDKNGKEIYEGDIISDLVESDGELIQSKCQVYFDEMTCQFMLDCSAKQDLSFGTSLFQELEDFEYEIIGNIYENPDL